MEEEGSWSPGPPRAAPGGRCEAWTMPAASGLRPAGAIGAPRRPARPGQPHVRVGDPKRGEPPSSCLWRVRTGQPQPRKQPGP
ncbi:putative cuticle collagen 155 [Herpailurus yagouaroundi]|uniref:putative cuticle collagen 155 n=1 Tax=Herpailurus yagouaroundi TaxID=1608482 RepID=UPI001AD7DED5|nr:putative cuticle collagen 155 [Puma yagouaroundi]